MTYQLTRYWPELKHFYTHIFKKPINVLNYKACVLIVSTKTGSKEAGTIVAGDDGEFETNF